MMDMTWTNLISDLSYYFNHIFHIQSKKEKKKNNNKNIFHSHENSTKKFLNIYITYLKREKMERTVLKEKGK